VQLLVREVGVRAHRRLRVSGRNQCRLLRSAKATVGQPGGGLYPRLRALPAEGGPEPVELVRGEEGKLSLAAGLAPRRPGVVLRKTAGVGAAVGDVGRCLSGATRGDQAQLGARLAACSGIDTTQRGK
jgi:hypothetical protein